jgi:hypothetical protein
MPNLIAYLILFTFLSLKSVAQLNNMTSADAIWQGLDTDTIPIELTHGKIILKISIGGRAHRFIFDTGSTLSISTTIQSQCQFDSLGTGPMLDATGNIESLNYVRVPELEIGKFHIRNAIADVLDYRKSSFFNCLDIDGLIGGDIFRDCIVEIDLKKRRLIIRPNQEDTPLNENEIPLLFDEQYLPFFNVKLNSTYNVKVLFDTGTEDLLTISDTTYLSARDVCPFKESWRGKFSQKGAHNKAIVEEYKMVEFESLHLGQTGLKFPEMIVINRDDINLLGLDILRHGVIHLNYAAKKLRFIPYLNEPIFSRKDGFPAFSIGSESGVYVVNGLDRNSDAEQQGLRMGMRVTKINRVNLNTYSSQTDCHLFLLDFSRMKRVKVDFIDHHFRKKSIIIRRNVK